MTLTTMLRCLIRLVISLPGVVLLGIGALLAQLLVRFWAWVCGVPMKPANHPIWEPYTPRVVWRLFTWPFRD